MKKIILIILTGILLMTCNQGQKKSSKIIPQTNVEINQKSKANNGILGNYVDNSYHKRNEGYDWVAVSVKESANNEILISVRSRADRKKPTCTFDSKAYKKNDKTYESVYNEKKIIYTFSEDSLCISTENKEDEGLLYFFCSGGATIGGKYSKINESLDPEQVDKTSFTKVMNLQGIGFHVSSVEKNDKNTLTVFTFGLDGKEFNETFDIVGCQVTDAEVQDLNSDGSPELMVYTQSDGSGSYGNVIAFSVNNGKSMSQVYFPPVANNEKINKGYMGHDEFSVAETYLVQRFPVYNEEDSNSNPTGGIRQITYKLAEGEAMRRFEVVNITDQ